MYRDPLSFLPRDEIAGHTMGTMFFWLPIRFGRKATQKNTKKIKQPIKTKTEKNRPCNAEFP